MYKYAVCVLKNNDIVGNLPKGKDGKFVKTIFFFLRADQYSYCHAVVKGKPVNLGDGDGMQVPCTLMIEGSKRLSSYCKNSCHVLNKTFKLYYNTVFLIC